MVGLMGLFIEMFARMIILAASLVKDVFLLGSRIALAWLRLAKAIICFPVSLCRGFMLWTVALASLPIRIANALKKERMLIFHLHEMEIELESLIWEKKELCRQLQIAMKDRRFMETILEEIEEEHDKDIAKIELLKNELQVLKDENIRLNRNQGKGLDSQEEMVSKIADDGDNGIPLGADSTVPPWKSGFIESGVVLQDLLMERDAREEENKGKSGMPAVSIPGSIAAQPYPFSPRIFSRNLADILEQRRDVALSQSLFSTILSLVVGMIIWEAENPCMPLVVALFTVVSMSLKSVVQFFSTIRNKPASEAVALLSFNCFVLGTLTSPTLPTVARILSPLALNLTYRTIRWLGFSSPHDNPEYVPAFSA